MISGWKTAMNGRNLVKLLLPLNQINWKIKDKSKKIKVKQNRIILSSRQVAVGNF
jgi:hypothetical protein